MKKGILKVISAICIATGIMSLGITPASASNYTYLGDIMEHPHRTTFSIDSWQWFQRNNGTWGVLTSDGHQVLANSWVLYCGKWYYIDDKSEMVENGVVWSRDSKMYYMQADGSMLTNGYGSYQFWANKNSGPSDLYADSNGVITIIK